jgi:hypothetical protein
MTNLVYSVATNVFGTNVLVSVGTGGFGVSGGFSVSWIYAISLILPLIVAIAVLIKKKKDSRHDT